MVECTLTLYKLGTCEYCGPIAIKMGKSDGASGRKRKNSKPCTPVKSRKRKHSEMSGTSSERKSRKKSHTSDDSSPRKHGKGKIGKKTGKIIMIYF